jgi:aminopeptidase N
VNYLLWFGLPAEGQDYAGRSVITFELKPEARQASDTLAVDFEGGQVRTIMINGTLLKEVDSKRFDGHRILFDVSELVQGPNRIEIAFSHPYSQNGNGLHAFKDPVDGETYVYTNFEPYAAHRMFPCFDQPDLKATFELTAEVPEHWQVVSNTREQEITGVDGRKSWQFPPSAPFSTYLFALHAGPYAKWTADARTPAHSVPLRLFARKSLAQYIDHREWFEVTRNGLNYFEKEFGYPYPFKKYDQVIAPDFNAGAMENVAAVTFAERYVYRTKVTVDQRRRRANTILHEMAHMWTWSRCTGGTASG